MGNSTREIGGKTFSVAPFMAVEGLRLKAYLIKKFGGAFAELMTNINAELSGGAISRAIEKVTENITEDEFISLLQRIFRNVIVNWQDENGSHSLAFASNFDVAMNEVFQEHLFDVYPLISFVLEVNYPDFFTKILPNFGFQMKTTNGSAKEGENAEN